MLRKLTLALIVVFSFTATLKSQAPDSSSPKPEPIFESTTDVSKQIDLALVKTRKENRRVLVLWGRNDSEQCIAFHKSLVGNRDIGKTLRYEYDVVRVEVDGSKKNQELVKRYGAKLATESLPFLTVVDGSGTVLASAEGSSFMVENATSQSIHNELFQDFLTKYQSKALNAKALLENAMVKGKASNKIVFLHFGAPWCGWCHKMEDWMDEPKVASILSKAFVDLKVDTDRMEVGQELLKQFCEKQGGIPWFAFVSPVDGTVLTNSDAPEGNVGFPSTDAEIEHFVSMLETTKRFTSDDIRLLSDSLVENRKAMEARAKKK